MFQYIRAQPGAVWNYAYVYDAPGAPQNTNYTQDMIVDIPGSDLYNNWCYAAITGSPNQTYQVNVSLNYEIIPTKNTYTILQPVADTRGVPAKSLEALACAGPQDSLWDKIGFKPDRKHSYLRTISAASISADDTSQSLLAEFGNLTV